MRLVILLLVLVPLYGWAQNSTVVSGEAATLASEISRLDRLSTNGADAAARHNALLGLARLYQLSGNSEASLKSLEAALTVFPGSGTALLEKGRLLISQGEYDKAAEAIAALLTGNQDKDVLLRARYLMALLEAFRSGNVRLLSALAEEKDFLEYRSGIYYALWKLGENVNWKTRLGIEFPGSPEAKIALNPTQASQTPLWLLFPGRDSFRLAEPLATAAASAAVTPPPASTARPASAAVTAALAGAVLQAGVFGREENALALADRLKKAGFESQLEARLVNGGNFWAVLVPCGSDVNAAIKKLKDSGFDSFPLKR